MAHQDRNWVTQLVTLQPSTWRMSMDKSVLAPAATGHALCNRHFRGKSTSMKQVDFKLQQGMCKSRDPVKVYLVRSVVCHKQCICWNANGHCTIVSIVGRDKVRVDDCRNAVSPLA